MTGMKNISPAHESAHLHVSGEAVYVDDIAEVSGTLYAALGLSQRPHAKIVNMDLNSCWIKIVPIVKLLTKL